MRRHSALRAAAVLVGIVTLAGCNISQLQFQNDHRLSFQEPKARQLVSLPLTISWSIKDFSPVGLIGTTDKHEGVFAVFVDQAPIGVGKDLKAVAHGDTGCKRDPRCPDKQYLQDRGVYLTTDTSLTLTTLPALTNSHGNEQHYVNVVLLDGTGRRIGESAWYRPFQTKRRKF